MLGRVMLGFWAVVCLVWVWVGVKSILWAVMLLLALAGFLAWLGFRWMGRARLLEDVPVSKVRSAAQGCVVLAGHVVRLEGAPVVARLSGLECCWYRYRIEARGDIGRRSDWRVLESGVSEALFGLQDGSGVCVVDPYAAEVDVGKGDVWYGDVLYPGSPPRLASASRVSGCYRYSEWRLLADEPLYVMGEFRTLSTERVEGGLQEALRERLVQWKQSRDFLARFDHNGDDKVDAEEWALARAQAHQQVLQEQVLEGRSGEEVHVVNKPEDASAIFLLSNVDPLRLVRRYRMLGRVVLGFTLLLGAFALWLLQG